MGRGGAGAAAARQEHRRLRALRSARRGVLVYYNSLDFARLWFYLIEILIPLGGKLGATLQQFAWPVARNPFLSLFSQLRGQYQRDNVPLSHQPGWLE